jgi:choline dehydrogenase
MSALRYLISRTGVLSTAAAEVGAFVKAMPGSSRPDAELQIGIPGTYQIASAARLECTVRSLRPESQGTVMIRSADPTDPPVIRWNPFSADYDRRLTVHMVCYARHLLREPPLRRHLDEETFPGPECRSPEQIIEICRRLGSPGSHFAGTCHMGQDSIAVTDPTLRVRGVSGLRVVDCSIMPTLISGNTNGPIMTMAWRAADLILAGSS